MDLKTGEFRVYEEGRSATSVDRTPDGNLWFSSTGGGVKRFNQTTGEWKVYRHDVDDSGSIANNFAWNLMVDRFGTLWVATLSGLDRYRPETDDFEHLRNPDDQYIGLSHNMTHCLFEDSQGRFWIGTWGGLTLFNRDDGSFLSYTPGNSTLESPQVSDIIEDDQGHLWLAHYGGEGITRFNPETGVFKTYGAKDGIRIGGSWDLAKGQDGYVLAAGTEGWTRFLPEQLGGSKITPAVEITGFHIANELVLPGDVRIDGHNWMDLKSIELKHSQNDLSFEFVGLHFTAPELNLYNYMLEGFDKSWRGETRERVATFTNLPFGTYTFRVKAANSDGIWNEQGASLAITILPPWWRTWWAYTLYGLLFVATLITASRIQRRRLIAKEREKTRERELAQAKEIEKAYTQLKTTQQQLIQQEKMASLGQLTSGIAHEIKNPLNFVNNFSRINGDLIEELEEILESPSDEVQDILGDLKQNESRINEHGQRADRIVRSMMRHASGASGERRSVNVNALVDEYANLAYHGMRTKYADFQVEIIRQYDDKAGEVEMVPREIGQVLVNLFNNSFDAVRESEVRIPKSEVRVETMRDGEFVEIRVSDNGVGIPRSVQERIFEPFFTTKPTGSGTGLGLSLSYDIVTQGHGGQLEVESEEGEGATFMVRLPG